MDTPIGRYTDNENEHKVAENRHRKVLNRKYIIEKLQLRNKNCKQIT